MISPENMHISNIIQIENYIFKNTQCICVCVYVTKINAKAIYKKIFREEMEEEIN